MANPMLTELNQSRANPIKSMMQMIKSAGNPQMMLQQMMSQNPQLHNVMKYVNANGGSPKEAFYKMAKEKGVNPDEILKMLK